MPTPPGPGRSSMRMRNGRNVAAIAACASSQSDVRAAGNRSNGSAAMRAFCRPAAVIPQHPPTTSQVNRCVSTQAAGRLPIRAAGITTLTLAAGTHLQLPRAAATLSLGYAAGQILGPVGVRPLLAGAPAADAA